MKVVNKDTESKSKFADNHVQIFLSPQVKGSVFINNKLAYKSCLTSCQTT